MNEQIKKVAILITSCGIRPTTPFSMLVGSIISFPLLYVFSFCASTAPEFFWWALLAFFVVSVAATQITLAVHDAPVSFVIDKVCGIMIAFVHVPLALKTVVVGFAIFHLLRIAMPFILTKLTTYNLEEELGSLGLFIYSLTAGFVVHVFLRLALWTAS